LTPCQSCAKIVSDLSRLHNAGDYLLRFLLTEDLNCGRPYVSLGGDHGIITSALGMDDEVIGSYGEMVDLDVNAKFFYPALGRPLGGSTLPLESITEQRELRRFSLSTTGGRF
jgi:hypothetical protein